ncbi:periplasmic heavy metal sensor [Szabonella alba]|uniref:Periplasmic heavy metal sensor n=1 Tax=Szabonella alba TaxID=2804194 RepID=A0A8K0V6K1_9RHOB|nr:periplasmic heavy metal sensor [Szabonella alba]MBL4916372.1 periplasmic heavy metal sensor [Szabonella alba]
MAENRQPGTDNQPLPSDPPGRPGKWLKTVLVLSLALNLGVAGLVLGNHLKGRGEGPRPHSVRDLGFGFFGPALTEEDHHALRAAFVERAPDLREARAAMREDLTAVLAAIRAEPFDVDGFEAALSRSSARSMERRALGEALIRDHLAGLDAAARAQFAERLEDGLRRRAEAREKRREGRPDDEPAGQEDGPPSRP